MDELKKAFKNPGAAYRGKPFWAWNGKLEAEELRRQIRIMHQMGLGGFFMHSRVGLATAYLSDEWFDLVNACVDEARKLDMEAWLYDEDRWPSGAAGGLVTCDPKYRHKNLFMETRDPADAEFDEEPMALFAAKVDGLSATDVQRLGGDWSPGDLPEGATILAFFVRPDEPDTWYNDATYLDTMNHEAVQKFIEVTHEAYKENTGEFFGNIVPGIFTDEPHHGWVFGRGFFDGSQPTLIPWTQELPRYFRERYGYDILDHLPELFLTVDGKELSQARYHYHDCKTFLFVDAFARQIGEWCAENDLLFTGHVLSEPTLRSQAQVGGAPMRFYQYMQAPGIDMLTDQRPEYSTAKQCESVKNQMGRRWMLSELYGCTGWDWPFEGHKAIGDWQAALGVNLRCQHLSWYTMSGQAKRDYPASISFQSPWWDQYSKVEDYFARVDAVLSHGRAVNNLLVLHPIESTWARASADWMTNDAQKRLEKDFDSLLHWLLDEHVDFDYGDEALMATLGSVETGDEPLLKINQGAYSVVLVPPMDTIRTSTLDLLRQFAEAGGTVVFAGDVPAYVDAQPSDAAAQLAEGCDCVAFERMAISRAVEKARTVDILDQAGSQKDDVLYMLRRDGDAYSLFMCNTRRDEATGPLTVYVKAGGNVQLWDGETGERYAVDAQQKDGVVSFTTSMPASGSRIFAITPEAEELPAIEEFQYLRAVDLPASQWTASLSDHNVLVLDAPEFKIADAEWQGPMEILKADATIRESMGLAIRGGRMVQPWAREKVEGPTERIALRYRIQVDEAPKGAVFLAIENPECFEIRLNGTPLSIDNECGWWVDPSIRLLPFDQARLVQGENELLLTGTMHDDCNLETCFLLGDFAVQVDGAKARITGPLGNVTFGDWTQQGMPFYGGNVAFRTQVSLALEDGERVFLEVPGFAGAAVRVLVDGQQAGVIAWEPHELEVTQQMAGKDRAELVVEVLGNRRNAFGPLHDAKGQGGWVGPNNFVTTGDAWQDDYALVPVGCLEAPKLSVRKAL